MTTYDCPNMGSITAVNQIKPKQQAFADEYLTGEKSGKAFNGFAAARAVGYPEQYASRLLRHPAVTAYIKEKLDLISMSTTEILMRFSDIARGEVGEVVTLRTLDNGAQVLDIDPVKVVEKRRLIKGFSFDSNGNPKVEFHDPMDALKQVARIRGMLKDGLEVSGPGGGAVPVAMQVHFVMPDGSVFNPAGNAVQGQLPGGDGVVPEDFSDLDQFEDE